MDEGNQYPLPVEELERYVDAVRRGEIVPGGAPLIQRFAIYGSDDGTVLELCTNDEGCVNYTFSLVDDVVNLAKTMLRFCENLEPAQ